MHYKLQVRWHILNINTCIVPREERGYLPTVQSASDLWPEPSKLHIQTPLTTHFKKAGRHIRLGAAAGGVQPYVQVQIHLHYWHTHTCTHTDTNLALYGATSHYTPQLQYFICTTEKEQQERRKALHEIIKDPAGMQQHSSGCPFLSNRSNESCPSDH